MWNPLLILASIAAAALGWRLGEFRAKRRITRVSGERLLDALQAVEPTARARYARDGVELVVGSRRVWVPARRLARMAEFPESVAIEDHLLADVRRELRRTDHRLERAAIERDVVPVVLPRERVERRDLPRLSRPLGDELDMVFAVGTPSQSRWLTPADVVDAALDDETLHRAAMANLWAASDGATIVQEDREGREVYRFAVGDGLDATRVLLRPLWREIGERCGSSLVFCMPARDRVYAAPRSQPESLNLLTEHLARDWRRRNHVVSPRLWVWRGPKLVPWELNG